MKVDYIPFASLLSNIVDNRGKTCPTAEQGIPLIATNCIRNEFLYPVFEKIRYVSEETYHSWFREHPLTGDLIFVTKGTPGRVCLTPDPVNFCIAQDMVAVRADEKKIYPKYLFAILRSSEIQRQIENMHVGTLIPHFKKGDFDKLFLPVPDRKSQEFIGDTYFILSYKMELNHKMNETLEAIAKAIFKSWFVDFDPISDLGHHKEWQDSPLGKIPKGWRIARVSEAFVINPSRQIKKGMQYSHIDMASLPTASARVTNVIRREFTGSGSKFKNGDVLFARITPCLENGKTALVDFLPENEYGWGSTEFIVFSPKEPLNPWFVYCVTRNQAFRDHAIRAMSGTSGRQRVEIGCFNNYMIVVPPAEVINEFGDIVRPWFKQMKANDDQSRTLSAIRDALLPKLLSGEIRVKDAKSFAGFVV